MPLFQKSRFLQPKLRKTSLVFLKTSKPWEKNSLEKNNSFFFLPKHTFRKFRKSFRSKSREKFSPTVSEPSERDIWKEVETGETRQADRSEWTDRKWQRPQAVGIEVGFPKLEVSQFSIRTIILLWSRKWILNLFICFIMRWHLTCCGWVCCIV